ncbi:hypothetical protein TYRP_003689 [Tyrophagus putrescentiae]|nr:hypothetical protein TYRP_003689 [Tyrophagus putrescentiae]
MNTVLLRVLLFSILLLNVTSGDEEAADTTNVTTFSTAIMSPTIPTNVNFTLTGNTSTSITDHHYYYYNRSSLKSSPLDADFSKKCSPVRGGKSLVIPVWVIYVFHFLCGFLVGIVFIVSVFAVKLFKRYCSGSTGRFNQQVGENDEAGGNGSNSRRQSSEFSFFKYVNWDDKWNKNGNNSSGNGNGNGNSPTSMPTSPQQELQLEQFVLSLKKLAEARAKKTKEEEKAAKKIEVFVEVHQPFQPFQPSLENIEETRLEDIVVEDR